jgi:hypothetical protein
MPLLIIVIFAAVVVWFLLSTFFEKIGALTINFFKKFIK